MNMKLFFLQNTKLIFSFISLKILYFLSFFGVGICLYLSIFQESFTAKYIISISILLILGFITLVFLEKQNKILRLKIEEFKRS